MSEQFYALKYTRKGDTYFMHFCRTLRTAQCYQSRPDEPIYIVEVNEAPAGRYYGWKDHNNNDPSGKGLYDFIWPSEVQFRMCFPYGPEAEVERGRGEIVRLSVTLKGSVE